MNVNFWVNCGLKIVLFLIQQSVCFVHRFQRHVHTYRILPDADGLLAVQVRRQRVC